MITLRWGKQMISCAALLVTGIPIHIHAQVAVAAETPSYSVSSIHPSDPNAPQGVTLNVDADSLRGHDVTLIMLIRTAYSLTDDQISGGPNWIRSSRFDFLAKADAPLDPGLEPEAMQALQLKMIQQFLAERFQLRLHHETMDRPGYLLTLAKNGPHGLQPDDTKEPGLSVTDGKLHATAASMDQLAFVLEHVIQTPVKNTTGLAGKFDIDLNWDARQTRNAAAADAATDNGPSIFVALQQQLGLRLEPHKTPADSVVIESVQLPQEN